jgi:hypothetical protein
MTLGKAIALVARHPERDEGFFVKGNECFVRLSMTLGKAIALVARHPGRDGCFPILLNSQKKPEVSDIATPSGLAVLYQSKPETVSEAIPRSVSRGPLQASAEGDP